MGICGRLSWAGVCLLTVALTSTACRPPGRGTAVKGTGESQKDFVTLFGAEKINASCRGAYNLGVQEVTRSISGGEPTLARLDSVLAKVAPEDCREAFSFGAFDAAHGVQQSILVEYLMERHEIEATISRERELTGASHSRTQWEQALRVYYAGRLARVYGAEIDLAVMETPEMAQRFEEYLANARSIARESTSAVRVGERFLVTGPVDTAPFTLFDFRLDERLAAQVVADPQGALRGTYQEAVENLSKRLAETLGRYLAWRPGVLIGRDSWLFHYVPSIEKRHEKGERELTQEGFDQEMRLHAKQVEALRVNPARFREIERLYLKRESQMLSREIASYDRVASILPKLPLVPLAMYMGAAGLANAGMSSAAASAKTGVFVATSFWEASNLSAALALAPILVMSGASGVQALKEARAGAPVSWTEAADRVLLGAIQSVPVAIALPMVVGQTASGIKMLTVGVKSLIANGPNLVSSLRTMGSGLSVSSVKSAILSAPGKMGRFWINSWWKEKTLVVQQAADMTIMVGMEVATRESMGGASAFFLKQPDGSWSINPDAKVTLATNATMSFLGRPLMTLPTATQRFFAFRFFNPVVNALTQIAVSGKVDARRVVTDELSSMTFGTAVGEANRAWAISPFMKRQNPATQFLLIGAARLVIRYGKTQAYVFVVDRYFRDRRSPLDDFRMIMLKDLNIDLTGIDDAEIRQALDTLLDDPVTRAELKL